MQVTVVAPNELGPDEAALWSKFQYSAPITLSPYMSLLFTQTVSRFRSNARVAVIEYDGKIEAFLPFELGSRKIARPIGHPLNDLQGFIGSGAAPIDARAVIRKAGLRGWEFDHATADQEALKAFHRDGSVVKAPVIDLTNGYSAYLGNLGRSGTKRLAEKRRALERQHGALSLEWNSPRPEDFRQLIEWKAGKYQETQHLFTSEPAALRIVEELATSTDEHCQGVVSVLSAGDRPVAVHFGLLGHLGLYSWMPSYDSDLSRFSPGLLMWQPLTEQAASRGINRIDLGYGQHSYKFHLANDSYPVAGGAVWAAPTAELEQRARNFYRQVRDRRRNA
jgi:CelD/BcsL family acetyltransferase involved in cellulose biosynthesis